MSDLFVLRPNLVSSIRKLAQLLEAESDLQAPITDGGMGKPLTQLRVKLGPQLNAARVSCQQLLAGELAKASVLAVAGARRCFSTLPEIIQEGELGQAVDDLRKHIHHWDKVAALQRECQLMFPGARLPDMSGIHRVLHVESNRAVVQTSRALINRLDRVSLRQPVASAEIQSVHRALFELNAVVAGAGVLPERCPLCAEVRQLPQPPAPASHCSTQGGWLTPAAMMEPGPQRPQSGRERKPASRRLAGKSPQEMYGSTPPDSGGSGCCSGGQVMQYSSLPVSVAHSLCVGVGEGGGDALGQRARQLAWHTEALAVQGGHDCAAAAVICLLKRMASLGATSATRNDPRPTDVNTALHDLPTQPRVEGLTQRLVSSNATTGWLTGLIFPLGGAGGSGACGGATASGAVSMSSLPPLFPGHQSGSFRQCRRDGVVTPLPLVHGHPPLDELVQLLFLPEVHPALAEHSLQDVYARLLGMQIGHMTPEHKLLGAVPDALLGLPLSAVPHPQRALAAVTVACPAFSVVRREATVANSEFLASQQMCLLLQAMATATFPGGEASAQGGVGPDGVHRGPAAESLLAMAVAAGRGITAATCGCDVDILVSRVVVAAALALNWWTMQVPLYPQKRTLLQLCVIHSDLALVHTALSRLKDTAQHVLDTTADPTPASTSLAHLDTVSTTAQGLLASLVTKVEAGVSIVTRGCFDARTKKLWGGSRDTQGPGAYTTKLLADLLQPAAVALRGLCVPSQRALLPAMLGACIDTLCSHLLATRGISLSGAQVLQHDHRALAEWVTTCEHLSPDLRQVLQVLPQLTRLEAVCKLLSARTLSPEDIHRSPLADAELW
eukprot:CAMPEP_0114542594 /NCGR_PEP_ID=MMETSP0114-20121206/1915_1 /TAXON_ID=31324 /ORGANISM="Goniomonas sp, Strain m" /LENGTH=840 /DNA_ID=CAMNT_0001726895 /DNA_START=82 /DNA_END=2601 /DNA_ORIENTATION=-